MFFGQLLPRNFSYILIDFQKILVKHLTFIFAYDTVITVKDNERMFRVEFSSVFG